MPRRSNIPKKIISLLSEDPTITREQLSERLKVSYQAVQKHLRSLQEEGIVVPSFSVIKNKIRKYLFFVSILTQDPRDPRDLGKDYQRALCKKIADQFEENDPLVEELIFGKIYIVIGGTHDIILTLYSDNPDAVGNFVTRFLRAEPAIVATSTAWALTPNYEAQRIQESGSDRPLIEKKEKKETRGKRKDAAQSQRHRARRAS